MGALKTDNPAISSRQLTDLLLYRLSASPTRAGLRLIPERDLAAAMGIARNQIRHALDNLVDLQILTRKQGSGVYVRKVPDPLPQGARGLKPWLPLLTPERLFAKSHSELRLKADPAKVRLRMGAWWQTVQTESSQSVNLLLAGVVDQAKDLGHELVFHYLNPFESQQSKARALRRERDFQLCDGHLVLASLAQAYLEAKGEGNMPAVFIWPGMCEVSLQPIICIDEEAALKESMRHLAAAGCRRIAFLGLDNEDNSQEIIGVQRGRLDPLYASTVKALGLRYRRSAFTLPDPASAAAAIEYLADAAQPFDGLYVADDVVLKHAIPALESRGLFPGENIALIGHSNHGASLPEGYEWSRMEFHPYQLGRLAVQCLVRDIQSSGEELLSFCHLPQWIAGKTHRLAAPK
jgi:DNA-binding LacI/PurR family transcriptional regulator